MGQVIEVQNIKCYPEAEFVTHDVEGFVKALAKQYKVVIVGKEDDAWYRIYILDAKKCIDVTKV